jgi:hypothetical protein
MARIIRIKCDRQCARINEIDIDKVLETVPVAKSALPSSSPQSIPERVVLKCNGCSKGKIRITREMIERWLS